MESAIPPRPPVVPPAPAEPPVEAEKPVDDLPNLDPDTDEVEDGVGDVPDDILSSLRESREAAQPFGKTKVLEVPGYNGLLAIEYQYIGSEITEAIARKVRRETRSNGGRGINLLASIDTLRAACKRVLVRKKIGDKWTSIGGANRPFVRLDTRISSLLNFNAEDGREVVLGLFGSEHKIVQQNVILSAWLADQTRELDEDFLS